MKTSLKSIAPRLRAGFTLIELLVVVSIIAALASATIVGVSAAQKKSRIKDTQVRIKIIEEILERYKNENGEYPQPVSEDRMGTFFDQEWRTGAASMLYQVITGDGNDQIQGYKPRGDESAGSSSDTGEFGSTKGKIYLQDANVPKSSWFVRKNTDWCVIDGFRLPFQYVRAKPGADSAANSQLHNEKTFDLWSYGPSKAPGSDNDAQAARQWVTNWNNQ